VEQRLSIITIGASDLQAVRRFYEDAFGWTPAAANKDIVFFKLNGLLLAFFGKEDLAADARVGMGDSSGSFTLAYNVRTEAEVDALFGELAGKGVRITKPPEHTFFGAYSGYFADVEGNLWEIACNPLVELDAQGNAVHHVDIAHLEQ
jgi:catechol 2,3-dioxygenase-like lactoylglutathione lyase family enzyme